MLNLDTQYIKIDHPLQDNNNYRMHNHEFPTNGLARFDMSQPTLSGLFSDGVKQYTAALFKPLFDRLVKAEEAKAIPFSDNPIKYPEYPAYPVVNRPISYNPEADFSCMVEYIDETINRPPCKRRI